MYLRFIASLNPRVVTNYAVWKARVILKAYIIVHPHYPNRIDMRVQKLNQPFAGVIFDSSRIGYTRMPDLAIGNDLTSCTVLASVKLMDFISSASGELAGHGE